MIRTITLLFALLQAFISFGQTFEGKIVYKTSYSNQQLTTMMGDTQDYFIKNGDYKSATNGTYVKWQLYINADNKIYSKVTNSETLLWNDGASNPDSIVKAEVNKDVLEVLGYKCDELIVTCRSGVQKYYFNDKLGVDSNLFEKHQFGNWYFILTNTHSLPLKMILEAGEYSVESIATEIQEVKLDKAFFALPPNSITKKSPN
jgi:hypothetical protein